MSQWSHLYNDRRWRRRRAAQLQAEPLCRYCRQVGKITPATVADHVEPHRGDLDKFWNGKLQSLCETCHNSVKALEEGGKGRPGCTEDGIPLAVGHHWRRGTGPGGSVEHSGGPAVHRAPSFSHKKP